MKQFQGEIDNFDFYENWTICDHPHYGHGGISTFDLPEWKKYEGCKKSEEDGIPKNCECRKR